MGKLKIKPLTPYERIGGRDVILKVSKIFYDKVYAHPWIGLYFKEIPQEHIENQQADFVSGSLKGPKIYSGRMPNDAHPHMVITDELFDLRSKLLKESLEEAGVEEELQEIWLSIDESFRKTIVNHKRENTKKRYGNDVILEFKNPED